MLAIQEIMGVTSQGQLKGANKVKRPALSVGQALPMCTCGLAMHGMHIAK